MLTLIAALFCAAIIWTDFAYRKVPNAVLITAMAAVGLAFPLGLIPEPGIASRLLGFTLGLLVMLPFYVLGQMGAGDVKFFAVAGLLTGPVGLVTVWVVGSLLAFVHALLVRARETVVVRVWADHVAGLLRRLAGTAPSVSTGQANEVRGIPYAAYLAVGLLVWMMLGK